MSVFVKGTPDEQTAFFSDLYDNLHSIKNIESSIVNSIQKKEDKKFILFSSMLRTTQSNALAFINHIISRLKNRSTSNTIESKVFETYTKELLRLLTYYSQKNKNQNQNIVNNINRLKQYLANFTSETITVKTKTKTINKPNFLYSLFKTEIDNINKQAETYNKENKKNDEKKEAKNKQAPLQEIYNFMLNNDKTVDTIVKNQFTNVKVIVENNRLESDKKRITGCVRVETERDTGCLWINDQYFPDKIKFINKTTEKVIFTIEIDSGHDGVVYFNKLDYYRKILQDEEKMKYIYSRESEKYMNKLYVPFIHYLKEKLSNKVFRDNDIPYLKFIMRTILIKLQENGKGEFLKNIITKKRKVKLYGYYYWIGESTKIYENKVIDIVSNNEQTIIQNNTNVLDFKKMNKQITAQGSKKGRNTYLYCSVNNNGDYYIINEMYSEDSVPEPGLDEYNKILNNLTNEYEDGNYQVEESDFGIEEFTSSDPIDVFEDAKQTFKDNIDSIIQTFNEKYIAYAIYDENNYTKTEYTSVKGKKYRYIIFADLTQPHTFSIEFKTSKRSDVENKKESYENNLLATNIDLKWHDFKDNMLTDTFIYAKKVNELTEDQRALLVHSRETLESMRKSYNKPNLAKTKEIDKRGKFLEEKYDIYRTQGVGSSDNTDNHGNTKTYPKRQYIVDNKGGKRRATKRRKSRKHKRRKSAKKNRKR